MYSKLGVYFAVILALGISCHFSSQKAPANRHTGVSVRTIADGGHPPPPIPWPGYNDTEALRADGGHPPPPPWFSSTSQAG
jgi:hypothetical protein